MQFTMSTEWTDMKEYYVSQENSQEQIDLTTTLLAVNI